MAAGAPQALRWAGRISQSHLQIQDMGLKPDLTNTNTLYLKGSFPRYMAHTSFLPHRTRLVGAGRFLDGSPPHRAQVPAVAGGCVEFLPTRRRALAVSAGHHQRCMSSGGVV